MRKSLFIITAVLIMSTLHSCGNNGEYVKQGEYMCYTYWTFSFGQVYDTLPDADPATFKTIKEWLGEDARHVYFKGDIIRDAVPGNIKVIRYPLITDGHDYYYEKTPLKVSDYKSFKVIKWHFDDSFWASDKNTIYYDSIHVEGVDRATFRVVDDCVATDKNHVFRFGHLLPLADPATYVENWKGFYSKDKSHIWYAGQLLEDVDYNSFTIDKDGKARDKYGPFHGAERETADETTDETSDDNINE